MKKFFRKLLGVVAALGIVGTSLQFALEKNGVDPLAARAVGSAAEQAVDEAAAKYGQ